MYVCMYVMYVCMYVCMYVVYVVYVLLCYVCNVCNVCMYAIYAYNLIVNNRINPFRVYFFIQKDPSYLYLINYCLLIFPIHISFIIYPFTVLHLCLGFCCFCFFFVVVIRQIDMNKTGKEDKDADKN